MGMGGEAGKGVRVGVGVGRSGSGRRGEVENGPGMGVVTGGEDGGGREWGMVTRRDERVKGIRMELEWDMFEQLFAAIGFQYL